MVKYLIRFEIKFSASNPSEDSFYGGSIVNDLRSFHNLSLDSRRHRHFSSESITDLLFLKFFFYLMLIYIKNTG